MKELSIEEKAKAYDEAKDRMSRAFNDNRCSIDFRNEIFPELAESKDEKIRKELIDYFKENNAALAFKGISNECVIAWLEKQGGHAKFINGIQVGDRVTRNEDGVLVNLSQLNRVAKKQGEQKPADKVEPKFREGDWVVYCNDDVDLITGIEENGYCINNGGYIPFVCENEMRLWDITDAKVGDVLVSESTCGLGTWYCIFKSLDGDESMTVYCYLARDGRFETKKELCFDKDPYNTKPATKEQRDTLMKAMTDAGYTFDFEKKELKKIEQKPAECIQETKPNGGIVYEDFNEGDGSYKVNLAYLSKSQVELIENLVDSWQNLTNNTTKWSEEDEAKRNALIGLVEEIKNQPLKRLEDWDGYINWLKSLSPQKHWKPSDEQIKILNEVLNFAANHESPHWNDYIFGTLNNLIRQLKKL